MAKYEILFWKNARNEKPVAKWRGHFLHYRWHRNYATSPAIELATLSRFCHNGDKACSGNGKDWLRNSWYLFKYL